MKILIATDGSEFSMKAVDKVCALLDGTQAEVLVLSVFEALAPIAAEPFSVSADYYADLERSARIQSEKYAKASEDAFKSRFPTSTVRHEVAMGSANRLIIEKANAWKADLIVVGSHGRGFWGRMMLGSVSDAVVHSAPCSVLVVR